MRPDDMLEPTFYVSPAISSVRLLALVHAAVAEHPHFVGPGALPPWALPAARWLARLRGWELPLWRHTRRFRSLVGRFLPTPQVAG